MATGLQDWTLSTTPTVVTATKLDNGLDADKTATPEVGQVWYARDTKILYLCAVAGTWTGIDAATLIEGILTLYANMLGGGYRLTNIADPTAAQDAATRAYVLAQKALCLLLAGGTMSGAIAMGANKITGLAAPTAAADAARKTEVDTVDAKLDDVSQSAPSRTLGTVYQNTSGKVRIVTVSIDMGAGAGGAVAQAVCDANASPSTEVAVAELDTDTADIRYTSFTFVVPPDYYYEVTCTGATVETWYEWDLH